MSGKIGKIPSGAIIGGQRDSAIEAVEYRITSSQTGSQNLFATTDGHWEIPDTSGMSKVGSLVPVKHPASGVFAFNKTGYYLIEFFANFISNTATSQYNYAVIRMTTNNSTYDNCGEGITNTSNAVGDQSHANISMLCKVDDLTNDKIGFQTALHGGTGVYAYASSSANETYARFTRLSSI